MSLPAFRYVRTWQKNSFAVTCKIFHGNTTLSKQTRNILRNPKHVTCYFQNPVFPSQITSVYAPNVKCKWFFTLAIDGKWGAVSGGESTRLLLAAGTHRKSPTPWRHRGCDWWRHSIFFNPLHHPLHHQKETIIHVGPHPPEQTYQLLSNSIHLPSPEEPPSIPYTHICDLPKNTHSKA